MSWRADPRTPAWDENRGRILDAAERSLKKTGILHMRVEEVAKDAGCSRATLYRYFDDKEALVRAILVRKAARLSARLEKDLAHVADPAERIAEGLLRSVESIRREAWFRSLGEAGGAARVARLAGGPQVMGERMAPLLRPLLEAGVRLRADITPGEAAEWLLIVTIGLLSLNLGAGRTREQQSSFLRRLVAHALLEPKKIDSPGRDKK